MQRGSVHVVYDVIVLGLPWQHRRGSALLLGVGDDAKFLYEYMMKTNK